MYISVSIFDPQVGRDLHPSEVGQMLEVLTSWHGGASEMLGSIRFKLELYKVSFCPCVGASLPC